MHLKYLLIPFFFLFAGIPVMAQHCNCTDEFLHVKDQITHNYAGFTDKVTSATNKEYIAHTQRILTATKGVTSTQHCALLIHDWLNFFKDRHIHFKGNDLPANALQEIVSATENIHLSQQQLKTLKQSKSIEGIYRNPDSTYRIAIIKSTSPTREYAGVILDSKRATWKPGQVKLELKKSDKKSELLGISYYGDHTPYIETFLVTSPNTIGSWQREGTIPPAKEDYSGELVDGKLLSEKTLYLKIRSFDQENATNIDSLLNAYKALLDKTPNLIIDVRDNGGGADFTYAHITPYLYTNPVRKIGVDVLATEQNINGWKPLLAMDDLPAKLKKQIAEIIENMEQHKGSFVSAAKDETATYDSISTYPKKVAILINGGCASTTEEFLMEAVQSKKVTLLGEATAGVLDYANVREAPALPCLPYTLYYATTKSRRIKMGQGIDNIGVQPAIKLSHTQNWITAAQQFLEK